MSGTGSSGKSRVVVAGGGIAGLETLLALADLAADRVELTLVAPQPEFVYKPLLVEEPFDLGPAERHELAPLTEEIGGEFVLNGLGSGRPGDQAVELDDGSELGYDKLAVCVGGRFRPALETATTFPSPTPLDIDAILDRAAAESQGRIAFVVPPGVSWSLPLYEVALMTGRRAAERAVEVQLTVITPEQSPLAVFGEVPGEAVAALLAGRGIEVQAGTYAHEEKGELVLTPGDRRLEASEIIALPLLEGPAIDGLPSDDGGFIPIDDHARVAGVENVYAAGDGANFPIKQGGIGTQQADAAAQDIAASVGADLDPEPFRPILRGKLLTGDATLSMRQDVTGGTGEGAASADSLWWPPHKVSGRYLATLLDQQGQPHGEILPPSRAVDIEVPFSADWFRNPMGLDPYSPAPRG